MRSVRRRQFLIAIGALFTAPLKSVAQQVQKVRRIGVLSFDAPAAPTGQQQQRLFRESLRRLDYEEGRSLVIEWRFAEGKIERLSTLAEELVRLKVELIVIPASNDAIAAAKRVTRAIPIVMHIGGLPVENGFIESLARPGGNVTGTTGIEPETLHKISQLLKEAVPGVTRVAVLAVPNTPGAHLFRTASARASSELGITFNYFDVTRPEEIVPALDRIVASGPDAVYVSGDPIVRTRYREIVAFALARRLVTYGDSYSYVNAGGLLYYGVDIPDMWDLTTRYVDRILKGARPADLPVEQPRKFLLIINAKTARAIGYKIPPALLARADRLIE